MGAQLKECNEAVLDAEREAARLEQRLNTGGMEEKQILDKLWESYELSHSAAMEQRIELESAAKAARRIGELKREISGLGTVNVGAIEEFDRVNQRYTYLTGQRDDVQQAKGELTGIIQEITREMTAIFSHQFGLITASFQETFLDLFLLPWSWRTPRTFWAAASRSRSSPRARPSEPSPSSPAARRRLWPLPCTSPY